MSQPLGHEPEDTRDREFAPVLREDEEQASPEQARAQGRKVTGTGVPTPVPADDGTEARSDLENPESSGEEPDRSQPGESEGGRPH
ncbi:hypothetical protein FZ103_09140 [Streptomonospora sp. PA3]|uniref:hypothetical protein n=1 Tax=Streptomonospora sp. PA3 TaxID=2607326 RepID=UPI0012DDDF99|nr:hypothetical protein [Streptomonospora sp. PA3]MUL41341.1 hypothetical protein [Streptomonospora sp. PA3]